MRIRARLVIAAVALAAAILAIGAARSTTTEAATGQPAKTWNVQPDVRTAGAAPAQPAPDQNLPPGAIKHPGEKCGTTIQPPEYSGCPGPPNDVMPAGSRYCRGTARALGECYAAERGFFNPSANFQPRNRTEACINARESGGDYTAWNPSGHYGRWQLSAQLWGHYGGQADYGASSPAEQDELFVAIVAADGYSPWTPWDGC